MPFAKGKPKTGGRKKGFPFYKNGMPVEKILDELKHNPIISLIRMAEDPDNPAQIKAYCEDKLLKYSKPQFSSVAYTDKDGNAMQPVTLIFQGVKSPDGRNGRDT